MIAIGEHILAIYSLFVITLFMVLDLKKLTKNKNAGWITVFLIPVLIFLVNIIWR